MVEISIFLKACRFRKKRFMNKSFPLARRIFRLFHGMSADDTGLVTSGGRLRFGQAWNFRRFPDRPPDGLDCSGTESIWPVTPRRPSVTAERCRRQWQLFFVSCEQVFHPALSNRPVIVLSGNEDVSHPASMKPERKKCGQEPPGSESGIDSALGM